MGKNTPGKQKTVRLSEEELKELCQKAVEDGVSKYITVQNQKKKQEWRGLLFRTKKLLENYTKLNGFAKRTGKKRRSGYCEYPLMKFDTTKMLMYEEVR